MNIPIQTMSGYQKSLMIFSKDESEQPRGLPSLIFLYVHSLTILLLVNINEKLKKLYINTVHYTNI
jgi:hypothetical protein